MTESDRVRDLARDVGFSLCHIASAAEMPVARRRYLDWIADGRQAEMRWMTPQRAERSSDPESVLPRARSVICVGLTYWNGPRVDEGPGRGKIARYAWGRDYHVVLGDRLQALADKLRTEFGGEHRWYVDTGPLMDKALAVEAGLGWYGKHTNVLTESAGSWLLLGEIVTTLALPPDKLINRDCGACRLCQVACPTNALAHDYSIDSRRCISYLTIEHRGSIDSDLRPLMGSWVFGCDVCQEVCPPGMAPFHRDEEGRRSWAMELKASVVTGESPASGSMTASGQIPVDAGNPLFPGPLRQSVDLVWLLGLRHEEYIEVFRGTSIRRAKVWMLRRNAAVALGNVGGEDALPSLRSALLEDEFPIVRGHAAWAVGQIGQRGSSSAATDILEDALRHEDDPEVRAEIEVALRSLASGCNG